MMELGSVSSLTVEVGWGWEVSLWVNGQECFKMLLIILLMLQSSHQVASGVLDGKHSLFKKGRRHTE